ncbi:MAG TPA: hypothetical protein VE173_15885, partial [Longimicrobiales bacterium]|nr:hypothetical protein [Longimicrobiales bacterium]
MERTAVAGPLRRASAPRAVSAGPAVTGLTLVAALGALALHPAGARAQEPAPDIDRLRDRGPGIPVSMFG